MDDRWQEEYRRKVTSADDAAALIADRMGARSRVGVVEWARLPGGISRSLLAAGADMAIEDASALFRAVRAPPLFEGRDAFATLLLEPA